MYTGTLIDQLIQAVQRVEVEAKPASEAQGQSGMVELQMFMAQMQHGQNVRHIRVGAA